MSILTLPINTNEIYTSGVPFGSLACEAREYTHGEYSTGYFLSSRAGTLLECLRSRGVLINDKGLVEAFLANHSGIVPYLYDLPDTVNSQFGDVPMYLTVFADPDGNGNDQLFLEIETKDAPVEANKKLNTLNNFYLLSMEDEDAYLFNTSLIFKR